ncbi:LysM domain-containing protein [Loktanella fryxellensis]|uniref:Potassium binding protein Kbp n=1 Tax=Loktanella fryxellensis TaxID=245187 RepID=A0A1H8AC00_9RHOB|nr:peptidoglycan-binding protein LysM [Loktanella fryxellensis]SEM68250.1 LysM domain-containing protein [Loktanella fryxellensis]
MGLWDFVKNAGKKLTGQDDDGLSAEALQKEVSDLGLDAKDVDIAVEGDKVTVTSKGKALTQEAREKLILAVGNVNGVARVEDAVETEATVEPVFYTVKSGDTLSEIAQATMGKASAYQAIFEANKPMLSHPDKIYPGQMLRIPQDA